MLYDLGIIEASLNAKLTATFSFFKFVKWGDGVFHGKGIRSKMSARLFKFLISNIGVF